MPVPRPHAQSEQSCGVWGRRAPRGSLRALHGSSRSPGEVSLPQAFQDKDMADVTEIRGFGQAKLDVLETLKGNWRKMLGECHDPRK